MAPMESHTTCCATFVKVIIANFLCPNENFRPLPNPTRPVSRRAFLVGACVPDSDAHPLPVAAY